MIVIKSSLNLGHLKNFQAGLQPIARRLVRQTAFVVAEEMSRLAPKDTAALSEGIYVVAKEYHGGQEALARASVRRKNVKHLPLLPPVNSDYLSKVGLTQPYWRFVDEGTGTHPAQPFVRPALAVGEAWFIREMNAAIKALAAQNHLTP
jgi:HK97 gp10 family phage protein